jgi:hypothetical protein
MYSGRLNGLFNSATIVSQFTVNQVATSRMSLHAAGVAHRWNQNYGTLLIETVQLDSAPVCFSSRSADIVRSVSVSAVASARSVLAIESKGVSPGSAIVRT